MAAPAGFNPSQSMLPDVKADIVAFQGGGAQGGAQGGARGGGQTGGAEDHEFLKQLFGPLIASLEKRTDDGIQIEFTNKEGARETFVAISKEAEEAEETKAAEQKVNNLYEAIKTEKVEEALKLIADADDLTGKDGDGNTALILACKTGKLEIVTALLEQGAAVDATSTEGDTPLMEASKLSHTNVMEKLLEWKANLNAQNKKGQTALWLAANANQLNAVEFLLNKKAKMELLDTENQNSALMIAVLKSNADTVDMLLKHDANPNVINPKTQTTPFTQALTLLWAKDGADDAIKANRKRIATAFVSDTLGTFADTGKRYAKAIGDTITKAKRTFGPYFGFNRIDPTLRKTDVNTPMGTSTPLLLAIENKDTDMILWLTARGAKLNAQGTPKKIPLFVALQGDDKYLLRLLLEKEANVNEVDEAGDTPLLIAIKNKNNTLIQLFVEKGSTLNKQGKEKKIPLFLAIKEEDVNLVRYLLEKGANVNEVEEATGDTPLLVAARKGNLEIVEKLLIYGADPKLKNTIKQTASDATTDSDIKTLLADQVAITALKKAAGVTMVSGPRKEGKLVPDEPEEGTEIIRNTLAGKGKNGTSTPLAGKGKDKKPGAGAGAGAGAGPAKAILAICTHENGTNYNEPINQTMIRSILKDETINVSNFTFIDPQKPTNPTGEFPDELNKPIYDGKTYDIIWFAGCNRLKDLFKSEDYKASIAKLYTLLKPDGSILFTEGEHYIELAYKVETQRKGRTLIMSKLYDVKKEQGQDDITEKFKNQLDAEWKRYFILNDTDYYKYGKRPNIEPEQEPEPEPEQEPEPEPDTEQVPENAEPEPTSNNKKVLAIGTTTNGRRGHDGFTSKNKKIVNIILKQEIQDNDYERMDDRNSLTMLTELQKPIYATAQYKLIWFTPDCQLEKIFTTNNYTQLIPKLYSSLQSNGYVLFTESPYLVRRHRAGRSSKDFLAVIEEMDKKNYTGTIEQIDILKKFLKSANQKKYTISPFPEYTTIEGKKESFIVPFMKEWNRYFLLLNNKDYTVYMKRNTPVLSSNVLSPEIKIISNPLKPIPDPSIVSNPLSQPVVTSGTPTSEPTNIKGRNSLLTGFKQSQNPITHTKKPKKRVTFKGGKHRTQRKKRLDA